MASSTFELVSPFLSIYTPSKTWNGASNLLRGQTNNALVAGELLSFDSNNGVNRVLPSGNSFNNGAATDALESPAFVYFSETGRGDIVTGGKVPVLQFGPFEADTAVFQRNASGVLVAGDDSTPLSASHIGKPVGIVAVRHPTKYASAAASIGAGASFAADPTKDLIIPGLGILDVANNQASCFVVGYISAIIGSGTNMKVRILFGL